jgi:hypothetical protein
MNVPTAGSLSIPLKWLRLGWIVLMTFMVITLVLAIITLVENTNELRQQEMLREPELYLLQDTTHGMVIVMLLFVMVASSIIFWKSERQASGLLMALTMLF